MEGRRFLICRIGLVNLGLVVLLLAEVLGVGFYFDIHRIALRGGSWSEWLISARFLFRFALAFGAVLLLIEAPRWKSYNHTLLGLTEHYHWQPWLFLQVLAFGGFAALTAHLEVTENSVGPLEKSSFLVAIWLLLVPVFMLLWLRIFAPLQLWWRLIWKKRYSLIAAGFITLLVWIGSGFTENLWSSFNDLTFRFVHFILALYYPDVIADPDEFVLGTPAFEVVVEKECSGYEGMGLVTVFLALYLWLFRQEFRFPQALLLFPLGLAVIWIFNTLRIATLIAIGSSWSPEIAMNGFHSQAGWIAFLLVALGLMWTAGRWSFLTKPTEPETLYPEQSPRRVGDCLANAVYCVDDRRYVDSGIFDRQWRRALSGKNCSDRIGFVGIPAQLSGFFMAMVLASAADRRSGVCRLAAAGTAGGKRLSTMASRFAGRLCYNLAGFSCFGFGVAGAVGRRTAVSGLYAAQTGCQSL